MLLNFIKFMDMFMVLLVDLVYRFDKFNFFFIFNYFFQHFSTGLVFDLAIVYFCYHIIK
jgi:hypothetical protein